MLEYCARVYRRTWRGTMFMTFFSPILFLGAMGFGLGSFVDSSTGAAAGAASAGGFLGSVPFAAFLAPGLLVATCMQTGAFEATYPIMGRIVWDKVYHAMLATPIKVARHRLRAVRLAGHPALPRRRLVLRRDAAVRPCPTAVRSPSWSSRSGSSPASASRRAIAAFAATQRTTTASAMIFRFVITPLFLFSGPSSRSSSCRLSSSRSPFVTPLCHGVALSRDLTLGTAQLGPSLLHLAILVGVVRGRRLRGLDHVPSGAREVSDVR